MIHTVPDYSAGMAYMRTRPLVVITLLQLCRAEISDNLPGSWYSANVIQDGFQPKPLSEIFSTPPAFSSTNPIIVNPSSNEVLFSTVAPPPIITSNTGSISDLFSKFPLPPSTASTLSPPTIQTIAPQTLSTTILPQPNVQYQIQDTQPPFPDYTQEISSQHQITRQTVPPSTPLFQSETPQSISRQTFSASPPISQQTTISIPPPISRQTTISLPPPISLQTTLGIPQLPSSQSSSEPPLITEQPPQSQEPLQFDLAPITQIIQRQSEVSQLIPQLPQTQNENRPNYILIYQQAPQYIQGETMSASQEVPQITNPDPAIGSNIQPVSFQPTVPTPASTIPPMFTPEPTIASSLRPVPTNTPSTVIIQPLPTTSSPSLRTASSSFSTTFRPNLDAARSSKPCNITGPSDLSGIPRFPLKIRVVAPKGSITNVMIKPFTTTTKKPTTTRKRKPKRNTYESCVDGCKGNRKPICGIPLSSTVIDTDTLKGFPSVCHMACHNSYRKQAYEQLLEGRCSLLRTRIRTIDSNTKLKRDELNKAQYFVDKSEPHTVVEFSGALIK